LREKELGGGGGGVSRSHVDILSSPASSLTRRSVLFGKDIAKGAPEFQNDK